MKKFVLVALLVVALATCSAFATEQQRTKSITVNPLGWLFAAYNAEFNFSVTPCLSIPISVMHWSLDSDSGENEWDLNMNAIGFGLKYYFAKKAVEGWYLGAVLSFNNVSVELKREDWLTSEILTGKSNSTAVSYGALIGLQSIWDSGFTLDFGLGIRSVNIPSMEVEATGAGITQTEEYDGESFTMPIIKLAIGYAF
ncbi:DUF3575 domain-containing protein [bacterium]|nr:DUF3575 domain-containing protein [bacterium]